MEQPQRVHYFDQQFLRVDDFNAEQDYHRDMRRRHNRMLHTPGIADGLQLVADGTGVKITPGAAIPGGGDDNGGGAEIVLVAERRQELSSFANNADVYVTIAFAQEQTRFKDDAGVKGNTRWLETPAIEAFTSDPTATPPSDPTQPWRVLLGRVVRGGASGKDVTSIDGTGRRLAGSAESEVSLTPRDPAVQEPDWVRLRWSARGQADVRGSLRILPGGPTPGNLTVAGNVSAGAALSVSGTVTASSDLQVGAGAHARSLRVDTGGAAADQALTDVTPLSVSFHRQGTAPASDVKLLNDATGRLALQADPVYVTGRLGVATSSPLQPLHVAGNGQVNNVLVGDVGHGAGWAGLAHSSAASPATYGFLHSNDGKSTFLNKGSGGGTVEFRVDNATRLSMDDAGNLNLAIGGANIAVNSKHALRANDSWLRLNQDLAFTSGTHTPGLFAPMSLNVGGAGGWGKPGDGNVWITGNLGVGTTDLSHKLTVAGGDISLEAGRVFSSPGRMHINPAEILYLLPGQGVIVSRAWGGTGGLTVEGDVHLGTSDANVYIGGNQTGTFMALHDDMWLSDPQNGTIEMRNGNNTNWGTFVGFFNNKSSAAWKRDIATVESNELQRLYDDAIGTRVVHYRYRDEDESSRLRVGVIAEEAPEYVRGVDGESVSIMEYASMLHGAIQVLAQRVERLERTRRARRT